MNRRAFIAAIPASGLALAGCLGGPVEEEYSETIDPGDFVAIPVTLEDQSTVAVDLEVTDGEAVDLFVLEAEDMNRWIDGDTVQAYVDEKTVNQTTAEVTLGSGDYRVAIDNIQNDVPATVDALVVID